MKSLRQRLAREEGFTLIELEGAADGGDVGRPVAVPDAEAFFSDINSYTGMTAAGLRTTYDSGLVLSASGSTGIVSAIPSATNNQVFCISAVSGGHRAHVAGPGGQVVSDTAATSNPCASF
jgi:hypothetical protein